MIRISAWTGRRWGRDGEACRPPSPTGPGFRRARLRGRKEAGNSLVVRSRSCWRRAPCESPSWCRRAPWSWWSSYSKWIWGSGVYRLYFPLFDPQVHGDCWRERYFVTLAAEISFVWDFINVSTARLSSCSAKAETETKGIFCFLGDFVHCCRVIKQPPLVSLASTS